MHWRIKWVSSDPYFTYFLSHLIILEVNCLSEPERSIAGAPARLPVALDAGGRDVPVELVPVVVGAGGVAQRLWGGRGGLHGGAGGRHRGYD